MATPWMPLLLPSMSMPWAPMPWVLMQKNHKSGGSLHCFPIQCMGRPWSPVSFAVLTEASDGALRRMCA
jgi:hypothetical protein